jgi:ketosteroid isomerase-like protein
MRFVSALFLICLLVAPVAAEQDPREADHQQLRGLLQEVKRAVNEYDLDALGPLLAPGFVLVMADQTVITDLDGLKAYFHAMFRADEAPLRGVTIEPQALALSQFINERVAVSYGMSTDTYLLPGGKPVTMESRWTATLVQNQGRWQIQSLHAGVNILDNPILTAASQVPYLWALGGLVLGLLSGWMLGRGRSRRSA